MKQNKEVTVAERDIPLEEIFIPQNLQRQRVEDSRILELAKSIGEVGLINRVVVRKTKEGYELVAGYRRFLAFAKMGREAIPARVISAGSSVTEQITLDENLEREDVNVIDEALWLARLKEKEKSSVEDVARKIGKSAGFVSGRLGVLHFSAEVITALEEGRISIAIARELDKCTDEDEVGRILALVIENGATANVVRYWVSSANATKELRENSPDEVELYPDAVQEYQAPKLFCDICEAPTNYMESKFVRMCPGCWEVARANLKPR